EARGEGLLGVASHRAPPQGREHPPADGAAAGTEHAAVRPLPREDAALPDAGAADLSARARRRRGLRRGSLEPARALGRNADGVHDRRRADHAGLARPQSSDRKSTRLNSSHVAISYAVFCLKKKKIDSLQHTLGASYK